MTDAQDRAQETRGPEDVRVAWLSDVGVLREGNEDVVICEPALGLYAVIDGVGGEVAGERGAAEAGKVLVRRLRRDDEAGVERRMREAIALANNHVLDLAREDASLRGMSCVLTAALVRGGEVVVGHVGDTRLYLVDDRGLHKITADHSPVGQMEDMGELSEAEARRHPRRNEIFRDVGSTWRSPEEEEFIDLYRFPWSPDAALLICSDGLTDQVSTTDILAVVDGHPPAVAVERLVALANEAGGKDNVSVLLAVGPDFGGRAESDGGQQSAAGGDRRAEEARPGPGGRAGRRAPGTSDHPALRGNELSERGRRHDAARDPLRGSGAVRRSWPRRLVLAGLSIVAAACVWWWLGAPGLGERPRRSMESLARRLGLGPSWTLTVGAASEFQRIQEAIDAALPGDVVEVEPGIYRERIVLRDDLTVRSKTSRGATLVAGQESTMDDAPALLGRDVRGAVVEGLRIVSGDWLRASSGENPDGGDVLPVEDEAPLNVAVRLIRSSVQLRDVEIVGTTVAGVELLGSDASSLEQSYLHDQAGPCVRVGSNARSQLVGNLFVRCGGDARGATAGASAPPVMPAVDLRASSATKLHGNQFRESQVALWVGAGRSREELQLRNEFDGDPDSLVVVGPAVDDGPTEIEETAGAGSNGEQSEVAPSVGGSGEAN